MLKAITLWQPWATLWAARVKLNETRGFATKYRGVIAIHAGKATYADLWDLVGDVGLLHLERICREHGLPPIAELPRRAFVGVTSIEHVGKAVWINGTQGTELEIPTGVSCFTRRVGISHLEAELGDYETERNTRKRYAFMSGDRSALFDKPIPFSGKQGIWYVPEGMTKHIVAAANRAGFYHDESGCI